MPHTHTHTHIQKHWLRERAYSKRAKASQLYGRFGSDAAWHISPFSSLCTTTHCNQVAAHSCTLCLFEYKKHVSFRSWYPRLWTCTSNCMESCRWGYVSRFQAICLSTMEANGICSQNWKMTTHLNNSTDASWWKQCRYSQSTLSSFLFSNESRDFA